MSNFDLHIHTSESDGIYLPEQIVEKTVRSGLKIISITDHDSIDGISNAISSSKNYDITIVPGIEISTHDKERKLNIDILGYGIDYNCSDLKNLLRDSNQRRIEKYTRKIEDLKKIGLKIDLDLVKANSAGKYFGKYELIKAVSTTNYKDLIKNSEECNINKFIKNNTHSQKVVTTPKDAIEVIKKANGLPILAHIYASAKNYNEQELINIIVEYKKHGLVGIEIYHPGHSLLQVQKLENIAAKYNLLVTGGSDYHGYGKNDTFDKPLTEKTQELVSNTLKLLAINK